MGHLEDFNAKKVEASAIEKEKVLYPYMPMSVYCQEAEDLVVSAQGDMPQLTEAGLQESILADIVVWTGAAHYAQSQWIKEKQSGKEAEEEWKEKGPDGYDYRTKLLHDMRYAFRNQPDLLKKVSAIEAGGSDADMIQDLNDISVLGLANITYLNDIGVGEEAMLKAAQMSDELGQLRALANGDKNSINEFCDMRNRMYTKLKGLVDEVRSCGKYVFWRDPKRLKCYSSAYNRRKNRKKQDDAPMENTTES